MLEGELDTHLDYHKHDNVKKIMLVLATPLFPIMATASFLGRYREEKHRTRM